MKLRRFLMITIALGVVATGISARRTGNHQVSTARECCDPICYPGDPPPCPQPPLPGGIRK